LFVQVTIVPAVTVSVAGENAKLSIATAAEAPGATVVGCVVVNVTVGEAVPQETAPIKLDNNSTVKSVIYIYLFILSYSMKFYLVNKRFILAGPPPLSS
jgi:hypothetical protein